MQQHKGYAVLDLNTLEPYDGNARRHDDALLSNSIKVHGQYRTLVVRQLDDNSTAPRYILLAGHGTAAALRANGHTKARCELVVCNDEEALQINLMDNRANDKAFYDEDALAAQLEQAQQFGFDGTGWDAKTAAKYLNPDDSGNDDEGEPPAETWAIIVEADNEQHQVKLLQQFETEGLRCRPLIA